MDPGPTYVLIVFACIIGVVISFVIFKESDNPLVGVAIAALVTMAGLAYGVEVNKREKEKNGATA